MHYQNRIVCFRYIVCFLGMSVTFFPRIQRVISQISPNWLCALLESLWRTLALGALWQLDLNWWIDMALSWRWMETNGGHSVPPSLFHRHSCSPPFSHAGRGLWERGGPREKTKTRGRPVPQWKTTTGEARTRSSRRVPPALRPEQRPSEVPYDKSSLSRAN